MIVSIALATYNGERYLREQLESFSQQSRLPDEVVISDDASSDSTLEIIKEFAEKAPFTVRWSQNEATLGFAQNFNLALQKTIGDLVFLSDQDDVWFPDKIERMLDLAHQHPDKLLFMNDALVVDEQLNSYGLSLLAYLKSIGRSENNFVHGCCSMVRREMLDLSLPIPSEFVAHDLWIVSIANGMKRIYIYSTVLQLYRRHSQNLSEVRLSWMVRFIPGFRLHTKRPGLLLRVLSLNPLLKKVDHEIFTIHAEQLEWIQKTLKTSRSVYTYDLLRYQKNLSQESSSLKERTRMKSLRFDQRIFAVIQFWKQGGYQPYSGIKSAVRDVIFPLG